jgi:hypothetical protein
LTEISPAKFQTGRAPYEEDKISILAFRSPVNFTELFFTGGWEKAFVLPGRRQNAAHRHSVSVRGVFRGMVRLTRVLFRTAGERVRQRPEAVKIKTKDILLL